MEEMDLGTIDGKPITQDMLRTFASTFERDWQPSEVRVVPTERGKVLRALNELNIPSYEIDALERRAKKNKQSLGLFVHTILTNELLTLNE